MKFDCDFGCFDGQDGAVLIVSIELGSVDKKNDVCYFNLRNIRKLKGAVAMKYKTTQRKELYDFLKAHPHSYFTVKQLEDSLKEMGIEISVSAIYRNLSALLEMEAVKKVAEKNSRETSYRYINSDTCKNQIHITCSMCGKIVHMNDTLADYLEEQLALQNDFQMDRGRTSVLGICKDCRLAKKAESSAD